MGIINNKIMHKSSVNGNQQFYRNDLIELRSKLRDAVSTTNNQNRRDVLNAVIRAQTHSVNVSGLFPEVIQAGQTTDIVQKMLVHLFISANASLQPDLLILGINTILKDFSDPAP